MDRERRIVCKAALALGAARLLPACGNNATNTQMCSSSGNAIGVGDETDVPAGTGVNIPTAMAQVGSSIFICHDNNGFFAVDAGCTHLGCDVALKDPTNLSLGFACPCHGATYDANGENPTAPAPAGLTHYGVCAEPSGALVVDLATKVDPKTRFKP